MLGLYSTAFSAALERSRVRSGEPSIFNRVHNGSAADTAMFRCGDRLQYVSIHTEQRQTSSDS